MPGLDRRSTAGCRRRGSRHSARRCAGCGAGAGCAAMWCGGDLLGRLCRRRGAGACRSARACADRRRGRDGHRGAQLPGAGQLCRAHSADLCRDAGAVPWPGGRHRHRVAIGGHGGGAGHHLPVTRDEPDAVGLHRQRGGIGRRGLCRASGRRSRDARDRDDRRAVSPATALPGCGKGGPRGRQADRAAAPRQVQRRARKRRHAYRCHGGRLCADARDGRARGRRVCRNARGAGRHCRDRLALSGAALRRAGGAGRIGSVQGADARPVRGAGARSAAPDRCRRPGGACRDAGLRRGQQSARHHRAGAGRAGHLCKAAGRPAGR